MKTKILIILIIFFSITSGFIGAFLLLELKKEEPLKTEAKEVTEKKVESIKENKEEKKVIKNEKVTSIVNLENEITSLIKRVSPGVVSIIIKKDLVIYRSDPWGFFNKVSVITDKEVGGGTGFFVTKDGKIITNKHVVNDENAEYTIITHDNKEYDAEVLAVSKTNDIAILKIKSKDDKNFTPLSFVKNKEDIKIGQFAIAIGNALSEFQNSVSLGVISGKDRKIKDGDKVLNELIQTDAAINYGNSGGPLINLNGNVMGINTAKINGSSSIGFSISLTQDKVDYIIDSIKKYGEIKEAFIGINYIPISDGIKKEFNLNSDYGLYIINKEGAIIPGSPADNAGIKKGDIILEADGQKLSKSNNLNDLIRNKLPGEKLNLKVLKNDGEESSIELILGER
ncbi:hypothetical protein CSB07_00565 [Candidatus Gracilibacteria bacterium]|nr:MAG: hypothetical protein CSB07_00565 [Candidatus Gracilibacteria bacterium]PIE85623.1 MAG: hypothetical protein CSA08_01035 [Candidatus Gracilibacteria bacterium]